MSFRFFPLTFFRKKQQKLLTKKTHSALRLRSNSFSSQWNLFITAAPAHRIGFILILYYSFLIKFYYIKVFHKTEKADSAPRSVKDKFHCNGKCSSAVERRNEFLPLKRFWFFFRQKRIEKNVFLGTTHTNCYRA